MFAGIQHHVSVPCFPGFRIPVSNANCVLTCSQIVIIFSCILTPPALLLLLISHPDLPSSTLHLLSTWMASLRECLSRLPQGLLATNYGSGTDICDPTHSTTTRSASLVVLFVSRSFYSSISISSIVFLLIYMFILLSRNCDTTSESLLETDVALIMAVSLSELILLHHPPL